MKAIKWSMIAVLISYCTLSSSYAAVISASISVLNYPNGINIGTPLTFQSIVAASNGDVLTYSWDFGDGSNPITTDIVFTGAILNTQINYTYNKCGLFMVKLTVIDKTPGSQGNIFTYSNPLYNINVSQYVINNLSIGTSCWSSSDGNISLRSNLTSSDLSYQWEITSPSGLPSNYLLGSTSPTAFLNLASFPPASFPYTFTAKLTISGGANCPAVQYSKQFVLNANNSPACSQNLCRRTDFIPGTCAEQINGFNNFFVLSNLASINYEQSLHLYYHELNGNVFIPSLYWQAPQTFSSDRIYSMELDLKGPPAYLYSAATLEIYLANGLYPGNYGAPFPTYPFNKIRIGYYNRNECIPENFDRFKFNFTPPNNSYNQLLFIANNIDGTGQIWIKNMSIKTAQFVDNEKNICGTFNAGSNTNKSGTKLYAGNPPCSNGTTLLNNAKLNLVARDAVFINPGFIANAGSVFSASINPPANSTICNGNTRYGYEANVDSLNENSLKEELLMYPNPTTGEVNLKIKYEHQKNNVSLYVRNTLGNIVYQKELNSIAELDSNFNLSHLQKGIYIVTILADGKIQSKQLSLI